MLLAPPWKVWPLLRVSVLGQTAYGRALPAAYTRGALSFAYPVGRGSAPLLVTLGGGLVLAETPAVTGVAGAAALGTGLVMLARRARQVDQATAVGFALLTGLAIATYQVVDAAAVRAVPPLGYLWASQLGSGVLLAALIGFDRKRLRASLRAGARIGVGQATAYLLVLFAFQRAPAGPVATLRETSVLLAILAAREQPGRIVWLAATLCVTGAILAAL